MMPDDGRDLIPSSNAPCLKVAALGRFNFAVIGLVHGHVNGIIKGLEDAGASLLYVHEDDPALLSSFVSIHPKVRQKSKEAIISSPDVSMIVNCARPDLRAAISVRCLEKGKDVFSDKPGFLSQEEGERIKNAILKSDKHYYIYFSERFHAEGTIMAQRIIDSGRIGKVFHYIGLGPHRLNALSRPSWFFDSSINGDIIIDLGCHLVEQFLSYTGNVNAKIEKCIRQNIGHAEYPEFFDFGEILIRGGNGVTGFIRVDWFTPDGLMAWGDCRAFVCGTRGQLEVRKYEDPGHNDGGVLRADRIYICDHIGESMIDAHDKVGFSFFGEVILDCMNGTDLAIERLWCVNAMLITVQASRLATA